MGAERAKVIHVITKLELGGAQQTTLYTLSHIDRGYYLPVLICGPGGICLKEARGITDLRIYICPHLDRRIALFSDIQALFEIYRALRKEKRGHRGAAIVHTHSSKAGILGRWAALLAGIPVRIHTVHGFGFTPFQHTLKRKALVLLERFTGMITTMTVYVSKDNLKEGVRLGISRARSSCLIRSGIIREEFEGPRADRASVLKEFGIPEDARVIGMVACFKPQKAPLNFIRMAQMVRRSLLDVHFILIGDGSMRGEIEGMIERLGLTDCIHLPGWRRDIPRIIGAMDIMVLTSLWEGLPKVIVEAGFMGVPVVATDTPGVGEVIREGITGFITPPGMPDIIAERVIGLLGQPALLKRMGREAKQVPGEFFIERTMDRQDLMYKDLINLKRSRINK